MTTASRPIARDELFAALRELPPLPSVVLELVESLGHEELGAIAVRRQDLARPGTGRQDVAAGQLLVLRARQAGPLGGRGHRRARPAHGARCRHRRGAGRQLSAPPGFDHDAFWRHSIGSALCAQALAGELRRDDADLAFTVGLLHDIGRLALASAFAPAYAEVEQWRRDKDCPDAKPSAPCSASTTPRSVG